MRTNTIPEVKKAFLVSPLLVAEGHAFSRMNNDSTTLTNLADPCAELAEGTPQIVYDAKEEPYVIFAGSNPTEAKRVADDLGFTLGWRDFRKVNSFYRLGQLLGYCA